MNAGSELERHSEVVPRWYVACTMPRHEKQVAAQLTTKEVEHFLPLYSAVHRWKDRRMEVDLPLFPGYVFVRLPLRERLRVLTVAGVNRFVCFSGPPVAMADIEIDRLRKGVQELMAEPHPYLKCGQRVVVKHGAFQGCEGILVRKKDRVRVVISIELLMQSIAMEMDAADLQKLN